MAMSGQDHTSPETWQQERQHFIARTAELEDQVASQAAENARLAERAALAESYRERVVYLEERLRALESERQEQTEVMAAMNAEFEVLKRQVFGRKSEKIPPVERELRKRNKPDPAKAAERRRQNKDKKRKKAPKVRVDHKVDLSGPDCPKCGVRRDRFQPVGEGQSGQPSRRRRCA